MKNNKTVFLKFFALAALLFLSMGIGYGKSFFSDNFSEIIFKNARDAFEAYVGRWSGSQTLFFDDKELGKGTFEQTCVAKGDGDEMRIISTGKISYGEQSVMTRTSMFIDKGELRVDIYGQDGSVESYFGRVQMNSVIWLPRTLFMKFDYQCDTFFRAEKGVTMVSDGLRFISTPQATGFLGTRTVVNKAVGTFDKNQASPFNSAAFGSPQQ